MREIPSRVGATESWSSAHGESSSHEIPHASVPNCALWSAHPGGWRFFEAACLVVDIPLKAALDVYDVYTLSQIDELVALYLGGADRDRLDPILDACVAVYREQLDEDGQVDFKGNAKAFLRASGFLSSILPYTNADWEKLSSFLNFLVSKLPAPVEEDLSKGILEAIDMDSYRVEKPGGFKNPAPRLGRRDRACPYQRRWI